MVNPAFGWIDLSHIGLGDCVTTWSVLLHLARHHPSAFTDDCILFVPDGLADVSRQVLDGTSLRVLPGKMASSTPHPGGRRLVPRGPRSLSELAAMLSRGDVYLNWSDSHTLAVTGSFEKTIETPLRKLRHRVLELAQFKTFSWKSEFPHFIGMRLVFPILIDTGVPMTKHVMAIKSTFPTVRRRAIDYCAELPPPRHSDAEVISERIVVFPGAGSFNAIPASVCASLNRALGDTLLFAVHESDPWIAEYRSALPRLIVLKTVEDTLSLIAANRAVCVDGFASHLAQIVTDDCLMIYTREPRERLAHPGARPHFIEAHPPCAPCSYKLRDSNPLCPIGEKYCIAFEQFHGELVEQIRALGATHR